MKIMNENLLSERKDNNIFEQLLNNNYFENKEQEKSEKKIEQKTFHEMIQKNKDLIFKLYSDKSYFKDILPQLKKDGLGNSFYNKLIKKDTQKTNFFKDILLQIQKLNEENAKKIKQNLFYKKTKNNFPELERIKKRTIKFNQKDLLKHNSFSIKNNSFINKKLNINDSHKIIKNESFINNDLKIYDYISKKISPVKEE